MLRPGADPLVVLLLAETPGVDEFVGLRDAATAGERVGAWRFSETSEASSLVASRDGGTARLVVVAGRQTPTAEGLEVLALGTLRRFSTGAPLEEAVREALASGALTVLPWGFGKWWGRRGALVERVLTSAEGRRIFLGDNGGRTRAAGRPALFDVAERLGTGVLPGTDPFPFASQARKAARFGFALEGPADLDRPMGWLRHRLEESPAPFRSYGALESPAAFVMLQLAMQLHKRRNGHSR